MSRKLQALIQDIKGLPGKHKRVLLAFASFANNDGSNIYPSKGKVAEKAGIGRSAVYHNTEDLLRVRILVPAASHTCKVKECNKGTTHYWGQQGKYTAVYNISLPALQNGQTYLLLNQLKVDVPKQLNLFVQNQLKVGVQKVDATQALNHTPSPFASLTPIGKTLTRSASHEAVINLPTDQFCVLSEIEEVETSNSLEPQGEQLQSSQAKTEQQQQQQSRLEMPSGVVYSVDDVLRHMSATWSAFERDAVPTEVEVKLFADILRRCDDNQCFPETVMDFAKTHMQGKLLGALRSVKGFHNAICGENISSTNGLLAQFKDHSPKNCPFCLKKVQGVNCKTAGCKSWASLGDDGEATEYCPGCTKKIPSYRRESGRRTVMTGDI